MNILKDRVAVVTGASKGIQARVRTWLYDRNRCRAAVLMIEPRIKHLRNVALFLPFSCNERRQLSTSRCKAESLEVIEKMKKTARYG
jgi:hypothetical protein